MSWISLHLMFNFHYFFLSDTLPELDVVMDIYQISVITSKLEVMFAQFQQPKAFPQRGRRGSFNSTSKPIFVTECKASYSAPYFC